MFRGKLLITILCLIIATNYSYSQRNVKVGAFNFYPAIFQDSDGTIKGFYVDAFKEIELNENLKIEYVFGTWDEGLERIKNGEIDLMVSVAYTDERAEFLDYSSTSLLTVWGEVYVANSSKIDGILSLDGKTVAVMKSDVNGLQLKTLTEKLSINCKFVETTDFEKVFKLVVNNEVDAGVVNNTFGAGKSKELNLRSSGIVLNPFDIFLTVGKNKNQDLLRIFNNYLDTWRHDANSIFNTSRQKWSHEKVGIIQIFPKRLKETLILIVGVITLLLIFIVLLRFQVRRATLKVKKSETLFKTFMENSTAFVYIKDESLKHIYNNKSVENLIIDKKRDGLSSAESIFDNETVIILENADREILNLKTNQIELVYSCIINNQKRWFHDYKFQLLLPNEKPAIGGVAIDITKIKEIEQELLSANSLTEKQKAELQSKNEEYEAVNEELSQINKELVLAKAKAEESEEKYRKLINLAQEGIWVIDKHNATSFVNPSMAKMLGYSADEMLGKSLFDFMDEKGINISNKNLERRQAGIKEQHDFEFICKNGDRIITSLETAPIMDKSGNYEGSIAGVMNITERKQAEDELIKAKEKAEESDRLKTEFINNMSHEIRTPMNGILGFSNFLNNENLSSVKRKNYINIIQSSGNQLMRIIDDILEISKLGTKQVKTIEKEISLNDLLLEHFSVFDIKAKENKTPLYLKKGLADKECIIFTDETKLNKILSNLLENALKFTSIGFIEFGYHLKNNDLEIYVKDTGIGIKPESQEVIFQRFSQEEKELSKNVGGLGLGLSIAKENAELLGGRITLQSEKGKGSTFIVTIPYKPVNSENKISETDKEIKIEKQDKYTILIVEDEEVNYLYIETLLEDEIEIGCNILHAKHGKEAVEMCKENQDIDFVLMDMKMPIMNGFEATKLIKEFRPNLPIVAQTAYTTDEDKGKALSAGCDDFISKPISEETLNEILNRYLITK